MEECLKGALNAALRYLTSRMRTRQEVLKYLKNHLYEDEVINQCISILCDYNYINDEEYCKHYIQYGKEKLKSMRQIHYELVQKGIDKNIIDKYLIDYDEDEIVSKLLNKKLLSKQNWNNYKIINYLLQKGFKYESIKSALQKAT